MNDQPAPPVSDSPFVPAYADGLDDAAVPRFVEDPASGAFAFADARVDAGPPPAAAMLPGAPAPSAPPAAADAPPTSAPLASAPQGRVRRWGTPAALVAAGLLGGLAVTGAVTRAEAAPGAPAATTQSGLPRGGLPERGRAGDPDAAASTGRTVDQLEGSLDQSLSDDDATGPDGSEQDGRSLSDGFDLRGAPGSQGGTGASR